MSMRYVFDYHPELPNKIRGFFRRRKYLWIPVIALAAILLLVILMSPPKGYPQGVFIKVEKGTTLNMLTTELEQKNIVRSSWLLNNMVILLGRERGVIAGEYFFNHPQSILTIANRITRGEFGMTPIRVTIPEGSNVFQVAEILSKKLPRVDAPTFITFAREREGYLFPDTYSFLPTVEEQEVVIAMEANFIKQIADLNTEIAAFGKSLNDVVKMASILEEEARTMETRQMIAGILWRRLEIDMPLQVDASFQYVNGKNTYQLTLTDLTIDSPYNSYKYKGLPPTAISNPGKKAILAAMTPIESDYIFFLSDDDGVMHYAVTHDEHVANKDKYLR